MIRPKKIILVVIDTLRADHLGCYQYCRNTSPAIDKIAREGVLFRHAFSPSSFTLPVHASMFTSKIPSNHSIGFNQGFGKLDTDRDVTLAEILGALGYKTSAFVSTFVLRRETGLNSGFDLYDDTIPDFPVHKKFRAYRYGAHTTESARNWITENKNSDFFMFVHYFDAHGPYNCHDPYSRLFVKDQHYGEEKILHNIVPENCPVGGIPYYIVRDTATDSGGNLLPYEKDTRYYVAMYDGCIRFVDQMVEGLIDHLKALGLYDETLIIVTSDHGEAFGENDLYFIHSATTTLDQIHVPLIIKPPKAWDITAHQISSAVSLLDVMPTILSVCDYDYREMGLEGCSLLERITQSDESPIESRTIRSENEYQQSIIYSDHVMKLEKKACPTSNFQVLVPEIIDKLDGKKIDWASGQDIAENGYIPNVQIEYDRNLCIKDRQINVLGEQLLLRDGHVKQLEKHITELDSELSRLYRQVSEMDDRIYAINREHDISSEYAKSLEREIEGWKCSVMWKISGKFHRGFIEPVLPHGSRRRRAYDRALLGLRQIVARFN